MDKIAIRVQSLGKRFTIGGHPGGYRPFREAIGKVFARPFRSLYAAKNP